jgi:glutathione S-transferase
MVHFRMSGDRSGAIETAGRLLRFMEAHLADRTQLGERAWLAAEHPTIADLACPTSHTRPRAAFRLIRTRQPERG